MYEAQLRSLAVSRIPNIEQATPTSSEQFIYSRQFR